jgi:hypothetical protein
VSVKSGIRKIGFVTILALEVSAMIVVLGPSFAFGIVMIVIVADVLSAIREVLALGLTRVVLVELRLILHSIKIILK